MYCSNCGNLIIGRGTHCTNCGATFVDGTITEKESNLVASNSDNILLQEKRRKDFQKLSNVLEKDKKHVPEIKGEYITIREREKRIIEERIKKEIDHAKLQRNQPASNIESQADLLKQNEPRIIGEKEITGPPKARAIQKKISIRKKLMINIGSFVTGVVVFAMCMGYLFWRFAPAGDSYKNNFVEWMSQNANGNVNEFLFNDMRLNDYYEPAKVIDYSGTYQSKDGYSTIEKIVLTYKDGKLAGHYDSDGKQFELTGYTSNKGEFLLLETLDKKPTGTITGTLFSIGYLSGERIEQVTGKKDILSLDKVLLP